MALLDSSKFKFYQFLIQQKVEPNKSEIQCVDEDIT